MEKKPLTIKACHDEMERLLNIWLFQKCSPDEDKRFKDCLRNVIKVKGEIEHQKQIRAEERRAERIARNYGAR